MSRRTRTHSCRLGRVCGWKNLWSSRPACQSVTATSSSFISKRLMSAGHLLLKIRTHCLKKRRSRQFCLSHTFCWARSIWYSISLWLGILPGSLPLIWKWTNLGCQLWPPNNFKSRFISILKFKFPIKFTGQNQIYYLAQDLYARWLWNLICEVEAHRDFSSLLYYLQADSVSKSAVTNESL